MMYYSTYDVSDIFIFMLHSAFICLSEIACILTGYLIEKNVETEKKNGFKKNFLTSTGTVLAKRGVSPRLNQEHLDRGGLTESFRKRFLCYLSGYDLSEDFVYRLVLNSLYV